MANPPNFYEMLGVPPDADDLRIKSAFRALAKQITDPNGQTAKQLREAYDILTDPAKRSRYDAQLVKARGVTQTVPRVIVDGEARLPDGMAVWEYLTLKTSRNYGTTKYYINDENQKELKNARFSEVINMIGEDGWEMVGISTMGTEQTFVFKRAAQ